MKSVGSMVNKVDYIRKCLGEEDLYLQMAEEAAELSKAALKMARVISGRNPTPVTKPVAFHNVLEEIADVKNCMMVLDLNKYDLDISMLQVDKIGRWEERLKQKNQGSVTNRCPYCGKEMSLVMFHNLKFLECTDCDCWEPFE